MPKDFGSQPLKPAKTYSARLLRIFQLIFFLLLLFSWILIGFYTWHRVRSEQVSNLRILSVALANSTAQTFRGVQTSLDLLTESIQALTDPEGMKAGTLLSDYLKVQPEIRHVAIADAVGHVFANSYMYGKWPYHSPLPLTADRSHDVHIIPGFCVGSVIPGVEKKSWFIPFLRKVTLKNGQVLFLSALLPLQDGALPGWKEYPLQRHTGLFLLRKDGFLIARDPPPDKTSFMVQQTGIAARYLQIHPQLRGGSFLGFSKAMGQWRLGAFQTVPGYPLVAGASILRRTVWAIWAHSMLAPSFVEILLLIIGFFGFRFIQRQNALREVLQMETDSAIWEAKERAEVTLASIGDAVITTDTDARVTGVNSVAENLLGRSFAQVRGKPLDLVFPIINESTREPVSNPVRRVLAEGRVIGLANHTTLLSADGQEYAIEDSAAPIRSRDGQVLGVVLVFHDVTERRQLADQLAYQANHDALTQLPNRLQFQQYLNDACRPESESVTSFYVAILDLDGFKQINDLFGHESGDALLCKLAKRMQLLLGKENIIARLGGDEFGLLLMKPVHRGELDPFMSRFLAAVSEPVEILGGMVTVSATIGLAAYPSDADAPSLLLRLADLAMYAAKSAGRNGHLFYNATLEAAQQQIAEGVQRAEQALAENRFVLLYQPLVSLRGGARGVEALLRLDRGGGELLTPDAFASALDHPLLARKIGRWVLETAFSQAALWQKQGLLLRVGINISARHLLDAEFLNDTRNILSLYPDLRHDLIELEVTESAPMLDFQTAIATLNAINDLGIHVALDDFGTGNASLTYLQKLPAHTIKVDQSFVRDILVDNKDLAIVTGLTSTALALGLEVVAEGVETLAHAQKLAPLGVNFLQGYSIARPMPAIEVAAWVANYSPILGSDR